MKKRLISFIFLSMLLFTSCGKRDETFVKNIMLSQNEKLFSADFQTYDFETQEESYKTQQYSSSDIFSLCIKAVNENRYNFRLCENIFIDAVLLKDDFNKIFSVINSLKIPPSVNLVCFIDGVSFETNVENLIKTPLYDFSKDINGVDGVISLTNKDGTNSGAVIVQDGETIKYLDDKQWLIFNMLTGDRNGFSLLLRDNEVNAVIDWCDVYRTADKINITISLADYKGISDTNLIKEYIRMEITDIVYVLMNDAVTGKILRYDNNISALPDIEINIV